MYLIFIFILLNISSAVFSNFLSVFSVSHRIIVLSLNRPENADSGPENSVPAIG